VQDYTFGAKSDGQKATANDSQITTRHEKSPIYQAFPAHQACIKPDVQICRLWYKYIVCAYFSKTFYPRQSTKKARLPAGMRAIFLQLGFSLSH